MKSKEKLSGELTFTCHFGAAQRLKFRRRENYYFLLVPKVKQNRFLYKSEAPKDTIS